MGAAAVLTILKDGEVIRTVPIEPGSEAELGRAEGCVIRIQDRAISRKHAVFRATGEGVQIERRSEFAPLSVNGAECTSAILKEGDVVSIGPYLMKLKLEQQQKQQQQAPQPKARREPARTVMIPAGPEAEAQAQDSAPQLDTQEPADQNDIPLALESASGEPASQPDSVDVLAAPDAGGDDRTAVVSSSSIAVKLMLDPGAANVTEFTLDKNEIVIGRAKNCDIILNDDRASGRNASISRRGLSFVIKDLGSSNGTFVNGERITEAELSGGDVIRIGGADIRFTAESESWAMKQQEIEALPPMVEEPPPIPVDEPQQAPIVGVPAASMADALTPGGGIAAPEGIPGLVTGAIPGIGPAAGAKGSLLEKFRAMPRRRQLIWVVVVVAVVGFLLFGEEDEAPKKRPKTKIEAKDGSKEQKIVTLESLTPEQRKFVETQHQAAFDAWNAGDYDKALFAVEQIFKLGLADYKSAREIESYSRQAKQRLAAVQEERRKREEEARIKAKIQEIADGIEEKLKANDYDGARDLLTQMITLNPDNPDLAKWKSTIEQHEQDIALNAEKQRIRREIVGRARAIAGKADGEREKGQHLRAIATYREALALQPADSKLIANIKSGIGASRAAIAEARDPVLVEAKEAEAAGDYAKAYKAYRKASAIDPTHPEPPLGIERVRGTLHEKSKAIYTEGVMSESYSDLTTAKKKFEEVLQIAPEDDVYHERAKRKLAPYVRNAFPEEIVQ